MYGLLAFGDSITFGFGDVQRGWCGRLQKRFESEGEYNFCFNLGICGNTSAGLLDRIEAESRARARQTRDDDHHAILIAIGTNDARTYLPDERAETELEVFESNVSRIITVAKRYAQKVIVIGLIPVDEPRTSDFEGTRFTNDRIRAYNDALSRYSAANDVLFLDLFDSFLALDYPALLADGLHPNKEGYEAMYERISEVLAENGILTS